MALLAPAAVLRISPQLWGHKQLLEPGKRRRPRRICSAKLEALVFDCDGVILESEGLHRKAYNATFAKFDVQCPGSSSPVHWSTEFYDELQNQIGGGKPKMRWYFNEHGWPSSSLYKGRPPEEDEKAVLIDKLQDWKTEKYKEIIASGTVRIDPSSTDLFPPFLTNLPGGTEARSKEGHGRGSRIRKFHLSIQMQLLLYLSRVYAGPQACHLLRRDEELGHFLPHQSSAPQERFEQLDCFLAGDDVKEKKPDPCIYRVAAQVPKVHFLKPLQLLNAKQKLGVDPGNCLVVEDSLIGLKAAVGAGMKCIITFTSSTSKQDFSQAIAVFPDLSGVSISDLLELVDKSRVSA